MAAHDQDRVWFYYAQEEQVGPLNMHALMDAIADGSIGADDYVYKEGFVDWKPLKDVPELSSPGATRKTVSSRDAGSSPEGAQRKGERLPIHELVVAHNGSHVATGHLSNISVSGVFFETPDAVFALNDEVKITLKEGRGLGKPMHLAGIIVRQARDAGRDGAGYGLELRGVDESARSRILDYIKRHQAS